MWATSMPCALPTDETIPLGRYGNSTLAALKSIYRMGLGHRYGRRMQTISGIHYNWSLPGVSSAEYLGLIRDFRRQAFLLLYLFGASPTLCPCFVEGRRHPPATPGHRRQGTVPAACDITAHGPSATKARHSPASTPALTIWMSTPTRCRRHSPAPTRPTSNWACATLVAITTQLATTLLQIGKRAVQPHPCQAHRAPGRTSLARAARTRCRICRSAADGHQPL